jgi:hypothetical protein
MGIGPAVPLASDLSGDPDTSQEDQQTADHGSEQIPSDDLAEREHALRPLALRRDQITRDADAERQEHHGQEHGEAEPLVVDEWWMGRRGKEGRCDRRYEQGHDSHDPQERQRHHQDEEDLVAPRHATEQQAARPSERGHQEVAGESPGEAEGRYQERHGRGSRRRRRNPRDAGDRTQSAVVVIC